MLLASSDLGAIGAAIIIAAAIWIFGSCGVLVFFYDDNLKQRTPFIKTVIKEASKDNVSELVCHWIAITISAFWPITLIASMFLGPILVLKWRRQRDRRLIREWLSQHEND